MRRFWQYVSSNARALLGFALRCLLAGVWLRYGIGKVESGWLTSNPLEPLVELVAYGHTNAWLPLYEPLSRWTLELGLDGLLAVAFPLTELAIAAALLSGAFVRPALVLAAFINLNLILSGLAPWQIDGRIIVAELLTLALGTAASRYGWRSLLIDLSHHRSETTMPQAPRRVVA